MTKGSLPSKEELVAFAWVLAVASPAVVADTLGPCYLTVLA